MKRILTISALLAMALLASAQEKKSFTTLREIPIGQLMDVLDRALDQGYTVAWGGDVSGDFSRSGLASLPDDVVPTQELRQQQWDSWDFTYLFLNRHALPSRLRKELTKTVWK